MEIFTMSLMLIINTYNRNTFTLQPMLSEKNDFEKETTTKTGNKVDSICQAVYAEKILSSIFNVA